MTEPNPPLPAAPAWPPPDAPIEFVPDLPSPAYVVSRVRLSAVILVVLLPVFLTVSYARLFRNGLPISRLVNPGVIGVVVVATAVLAARLGPRVGRPTVVAGADWVAGCGLFSRRWRRVPLAQADRFSCRVVRTRSSTKSVLTIGGPAGERVVLSFPPGDRALAELVDALRAAGAREERVKPSRRQVIGIALLLVVIFSLPVVYFEVGPLRLLPRPVAGLFTWSGCRATLAAEDDKPTPTVSFVTNPLLVGGVPWRFLGEQRLDAATFARHTEHPADRLAHLQRDGFLTAEEAYLADPGNHVVAFETLHFATPHGALAYDRYVNRAVCEHEYGSHGPLPTEVRMFRGDVALARWVAGSSVDEVTRTGSRPVPTKAQVYAVAAALGG